MPVTSGGIEAGTVVSVVQEATASLCRSNAGMPGQYILFCNFSRGIVCGRGVEDPALRRLCPLTAPTHVCVVVRILKIPPAQFKADTAAALLQTSPELFGKRREMTRTFIVLWTLERL